MNGVVDMIHPLSFQVFKGLWMKIWVDFEPSDDILHFAT